MIKILVADDEEVIRLLLEEELMDEGYQVVTVASPAGILDIIEREKPDLVVLDIRFDVREGDEAGLTVLQEIRIRFGGREGDEVGLTVLQEIRRRFYNLPVVLYTAYSSYRTKAQSWAADYYVVKSSDTEELKKKIKKCLEVQAVDFSRLHFGAPVAERDVNFGLLTYFVKSNQFKQIAAGNKQIVLGNRGTGKSAILKVLASLERQSCSIAIELSPDEFSYEMVKDVIEAEDVGSWARQGAYTAAWKYFIYVLVMREFSKSSMGLQTGPAARVYRYIRDNHGGFDTNPMGTLISYVKRIQGVKIGRYEAGVKVRELEKLYKLDEINQYIPDILALCKRRKAVVLIDELDQGWDGSSEAQNFVAGLFQATLAINRLSPRLRVVVSLRKELYDNIPALYQDSEKHVDIMEELAWDEESLLNLISMRIRHTVPGLPDMNNFECWNIVFEREVEGCHSFRYVVDRTLYRPREIIQFCSMALETARKSDFRHINSLVLKETEKRYSEHRLRDIASEYRFQYPGLMSVFDAYRGKPSVFERSDLETLLLGIGVGDFRVERSAKWVADQDPTFLIEVMWRVGFLKAETEDNSGLPPRREFVGPHQVSHLNLLNVKRFQIHPMFQSFLHIIL